MRTMKEAIEAGMQRGNAQPAVTLPTARDIMATDLVVFHPDQSIREVIRILLSRRISGAPVVNESRELLGVVSEADCLRALTSSAYDRDFHEHGRLVSDVMAASSVTIEPSADIYSIAHTFLDHSLRRLPVIEDGKLIGQVSRHDVLKAADALYDALEASGDGHPRAR